MPETNETNNQPIKLEDFDFSKIKFERGKTPDDIKQQCFKLCTDYLTGVWQTVTIDEIEVRRISGGLTNQLYYCGINEDKRVSDMDIPQEVAIRLYSPKHFNNYDNTDNERLTDTIIAVLVSENGLGPKIYGIFEQGQIQGYYKHRNFRLAEQKDPSLVDELARKLARLHAMEVPIKKTGNWIADTFDNQYREAEESWDLESLFKETNSDTFLEHEIKTEIEWLKQTVLDIDSPVNFTHVDFRGSNIMITETDGIIFCDLEYSCYGFRGADIGTILYEWDQEFGDWLKYVEYPDDSKVRPFIEAYIEESVKLRGKEFSEDPRNSVEHLLREGKVFALVGMMFFVTMSLKAKEHIVDIGMPFDKKQSMQWINMMYKRYHMHKQQFTNQKVF